MIQEMMKIEKDNTDWVLTIDLNFKWCACHIHKTWHWLQSKCRWQESGCYIWFERGSCSESKLAKGSVFTVWQGRRWIRFPGLVVQSTVVHWQAWEERHRSIRAVIEKVTNWCHFFLIYIYVYRYMYVQTRNAYMDDGFCSLMIPSGVLVEL